MDTSWIVKGAQVVTYTTRPGSPRWAYWNVKLAYIERVSKKTFTVDGTRFDLEDAKSRRGPYDPVDCVVPVDSDIAKRAFAERRLRTAERRMDDAYDAWSRARSDVNAAEYAAKLAEAVAAYQRLVQVNDTV
jgi:hypothetical protein